MTLQPGVYYSGDDLRHDEPCDDVTLSLGVYYLNFPAGDDIWDLAKNVTGVRCERSGRRARVRRLSPHQALAH